MPEKSFNNSGDGFFRNACKWSRRKKKKKLSDSKLRGRKSKSWGWFLKKGKKMAAFSNFLRNSGKWLEKKAAKSAYVQKETRVWGSSVSIYPWNLMGFIWRFFRDDPRVTQQQEAITPTPFTDLQRTNSIMKSSSLHW